LEDLARSLYREWFVRFRFPGHQAGKVVDSELGPIPQGWTVTSLGNVCSLVRSGSTPRRSVARNWDGGVTPWFKTGELRDGPLTDSLEHVTTASGARLFEPDTILMAIYGSPTVGRLGWVTRRCSCNQAALAIRALDPDQEQDWIWYQLVALRGHFNSMAQGAAQQNISKEKVVETRVVLPPPAVRRAFADTAGATRRLWHALSHAKDALATTRDLLLPRLVTGRLDLSGIDLGDLLPSERA
jgi:type I restriction enzyme S subunit